MCDEKIQTALDVVKTSEVNLSAAVINSSQLLESEKTIVKNGSQSKLQGEIKARTKVSMIKNLSTANVGSATGNPRNKVALSPGHSLMDWIRLGNSGRDLTGVGGVSREVSGSELAKHTRKDDAWLAVKGRVYNVTHYIDFHPGGVDELMRGAGKDATSLFNEVHAWVNYESILQKCMVGPLRGGLLFSKPRPPLGQLLFGKKAVKANPASEQQPLVSTDAKPSLDGPRSHNPRLDWFQQIGSVTLVLYARMVARGPGRTVPWVRVTLDPTGLDASVLVSSLGGEPGSSYEARVRLHEPVTWPLMALRSHQDSGKVEVVFKKVTEQLWPRYGDPAEGHGTLLMAQKDSSDFWPVQLVEESPVNYNTKLLTFKFIPRVSFNIPIGYHVRVQAKVQGMTTARSYTPVCASLTAAPPSSCDRLLLMVKSYPEGALSPLLCGLPLQADGLEISEPLGTFDVRWLSTAVHVALVAAGTGLTPMLRVIAYILQEPRKQCSKVNLMFFNKTERDILWREQLDAVTKDDARLHVRHVLSEAPDWSGDQGRISRTLLESLLGVAAGETAVEAFQQTPTAVCVCGPDAFTNETKRLLLEMGVTESQFHCFLG